MNRPSRNDDAELEHPLWNQSPPFLAADLTTRQDLNGIANARVHRSGGSGAGSLSLEMLNEKHHSEGVTLQPPGPPGEKREAAIAGFQFCSDSKTAPRPLKTAAGGEGPARLTPEPRGAGIGLFRSLRAHPRDVVDARRRRNHGNLLIWIVVLLSLGFGTYQWLQARQLESRMQLMTAQYTQGNPQNVGESLRLPSVLSKVQEEVTPSSNHITTTTAPTTNTISKRALHKRQGGTCPVATPNGDEYNTPLHAGAVIIILAVSYIACAFPIMAIRFPQLRLPPLFFFAVRHFGTGVLISTAFVHLLPTAFQSLGNSCLPSFWTTDYPAMPGAIALAGIFLVTIVEMVFHPNRHISHGEQNSSAAVGVGHMAIPASVVAIPAPAETSSPCQKTVTSDLPSKPKGQIGGRRSSIGRRLSTLSRTGERPEPASDECSENAIYEPKSVPSPVQEDVEDINPNGLEMGHGHGHGHHHVILSAEQKHKKELLQCVLLEVGILFHSVFIGMALSVSIGGEFIVLLIAIAFHQTFEGLALGSRIAGITWPKGSWQPWLMALAYGCTTPIGQAIGLATHTLYSPDSETGLVLVGTMNAISAGLLVFASLVELLSEDFLSDESWVILRGRKRVWACILVFFGAVFMSLVGAWA